MSITRAYRQYNAVPSLQTDSSRRVKDHESLSTELHLTVLSTSATELARYSRVVDLHLGGETYLIHWSAGAFLSMENMLESRIL